MREYLGRRILDVGCGQGELLDYLPSSTERIVLLDKSLLRRSKVNERLLDRALAGEFVVADVERGEIPLPSHYFDTVVMAALLEHLKFPAGALGEVHRLLIPGGRLLLTTPTPLGGWVHKMTSALGLTYREAAEEHEHFYGRENLTSILEQQGFNVQLFRSFLLGLNQFVVAHKSS